MCSAPLFPQISCAEILKIHLTAVSSSCVEVWAIHAKTGAVPGSPEGEETLLLALCQREAAPRLSSQCLLSRGQGRRLGPTCCEETVPLWAWISFHLCSAFTIKTGVGSEPRLYAMPHPDVASLRSQRVQTSPREHGFR